MLIAAVMYSLQPNISRLIDFSIDALANWHNNNKYMHVKQMRRTSAAMPAHKNRGNI